MCVKHKNHTFRGGGITTIHDRLRADVVVVVVNVDMVTVDVLRGGQ